MRTLAALFANGSSPFAAVIVVDSLGSGKIAETIAANGWPVFYENADTNLGSAGNLARRLQLASELDCDWCLAVNHDGMVDPHRAVRLVGHGERMGRVGAVYPTLRMITAGNRRDRPRRKRSTFGFLMDRGDNLAEVQEVAWSSSNGALYRLDPVRDGMHLWPELWMGYEDLALGWELQSGGWRQIMAGDVEVEDNYEFKKFKIAGWSMHLADKPSWYTYYHARNLLLIARRTGGAATKPISVAARILIDVALIMGFRDQKRTRLYLLLCGVQDGLRNVSGKGPVP